MLQLAPGLLIFDQGRSWSNYSAVTRKKGAGSSSPILQNGAANGKGTSCKQAPNWISRKTEF